MFLSFIKKKQFFIPIEKENAIHHLPVDAIKKPIRPFDTTLHSKADRGGDEESTQAYVLVRRGVCRGDNKDMHMKATWYEPRLRSMVVFSCTVHCVVLALFFFIQGQQNRLPLNPLAHSTLVSVVNLNDLPGSGDSKAIAPLTPETKKEGAPKTPPLSLLLQKKSTVKKTHPATTNPEKLPPPPQENAVSPPFDSVNKEPVCLATPFLSDFGNDYDSPGDYEKSENSAGGSREAFSRNNGSGVGMGSGGNSRGSGGGAAEDTYLMMIRSKIEQHKIYPRQASLRQIQGTVVIHFIITLEGIIKGVDVVQSSGFTVLDQAGIKAVKDACPFPKPPVDFFQTAVSIEVPIVFELI
jgi:protein TonB